MKQTNVSFLSFIVILLLTVSTGFAAQTLYVTSEDASLKAESSSSSATIVELNRGAELNVLAADGRWYNVTTRAGQTGWIYRGKVSDEPPEIEELEEDDEEGLAGLLGGLSGSDIESDAADSSRSIRGLSPEAKEYANATGSPKEIQNALDSVIERSTTEKEINQFLMEGKVGEYAD